MYPYAREDGLVVQELPEETLVYDLQRHKAHCLNPTAALVWRRCDGKTTVADIARQLQHELNVAADEDLVWLALDRLERGRLLREPLQRPEPAGSAALYSRREVARKLALAGGLTALLPVVTSIVAPTPAMAAVLSLPCITDNNNINGCAGNCGRRCSSKTPPGAASCAKNRCTAAAKCMNGTPTC